MDARDVVCEKVVKSGETGTGGSEGSGCGSRRGGGTGMDGGKIGESSGELSYVTM